MHTSTGTDFHSIFESLPGCYLILTPDFIIRAVSDAYLDATKTKREEILGRGIFDVFPDNPNDPKATGVKNLTASLNSVLKNKKAHIMDIQKYDIARPKAEGGGFEERYWSPQNSPVRDSKGNVLFIIHCVVDVTQQIKLKESVGGMESKMSKQTKELSSEMHKLAFANEQLQQFDSQLAEANQFLDSIIENIPNMIFVKDAKELRFVRFNKAGEELLGYSREEMIGRNDYDFFPKEQADFFTKKDRAVIDGKELVDIPEEPLQTRTKGSRILHTKKLPLHDKNGNPRYLLGISEDITEAMRLDKIKSEFVSLASHQLRTPISIMRWSLELCLENKHALEADQRKFLQNAFAASVRMADTVKTMLTVSRLEASHLRLAIAQVSIGYLLRQLQERYEVIYKEKGQAFTLDCPQNLLVETDVSMLNELLENLISNAVKYTPKGGSITVRAEKKKDEIDITIKDSGIGIPADEQSRIFSKLFRSKNAVAHDTNGTGLGLYLCLAIAHLMNATLSFTSTEGKGTTFTLSLPLHQAVL